MLSCHERKNKINLKLKESDNVILSLSNNHNNDINHGIAKCGASSIEKQRISNAVADPDFPGRSVLVT